ncbi:MAG: ABC transporter substrate-binding protein [Candidatus Ventricola sp.]
MNSWKMRAAALMLLAAALVSGTAAAQETMTFTDDLGRSVTVPKQPQRVAAMIGSFADIWCLAGGKDVLVATADDTFRSFDLSLPNEVINLGATKDPSMEKLLLANPDLVIASCSTARNVELEPAFAQMGLNAVYFDVDTFEDYLRMLKTCTEITGCAQNYALYGKDVRAQVEAARARADGSRPSVLYIRASKSGCKVKGSEGSVLGEMLAAMDCVNIADSETSLLEQLSMEAILQADPDFIFVVEQSADPAVAKAVLEETLFSNPAWQTLTAVREDRVHVMDSALYNLKPNARWGEAYEKLADILYGQQ